MITKKLIVGLGNPGDKYSNTRHNVGFMLVDELAKLNNVNFSNDKKAPSAEYLSDNSKIILVKPSEYMNLSGKAVLEYKKKNGIEVANILVIHDEIDFVFSKCKMKIGGGHAGHNGLRDIIEKLGTNEFHRLRIGVGRPNDQTDVSDYVLNNFTPSEKTELKTIFGICIQKVLDWIKQK
jgi:PTH1 family peptidyl-tRNA hydrolase